MNSPISQRKLDHLRVCLEEDVRFKTLSTGLERYSFTHQALPELDLDEIDLSTQVLGKSLRAPFIISSMTGGVELAHSINLNLAKAAEDLGVGLGLGSGRAAVDLPHLAYTYQVRDVAPHILLLANLGAVQLNYGYGIDECRQAVEIIGADGLILHLNPLQECLQEGGNTNFRGLADKITSLCQVVSVPVIVKEVGWGISFEIARKLLQAGVKGIDTGSSGGTSWSEVEKYLAVTESRRRMAENFEVWGIPTADSIVACRKAAPGLLLIASGGIRTGIDAAKAIALGADVVGVAGPLLKPATISAEAVRRRVARLILELRITMFCVGAANLAQLRRIPLQEMRRS
ncbi:MAG: type 2 isopentenyl-diphosphate Delta-isomerase [Chloroflexi bacterium]|nr:type 2 isopentenyl-diphosphate Delta-isomerase [Chloroflexota bacterium]